MHDTKMTRRAALIGLTSISSLIISGCGTATQGSKPSLTPTVGPTPTPTPANTLEPTPTEVVRQTPGTTLVTYKGHQQSLLGLNWSADNKQISSIDRMGEVHIWNVVTGNRESTFSLAPEKNIFLETVRWSPDGKYIATLTSYQGKNYTVTIWDATTGNKFIQLNKFTSRVLTLAFSPDGQLLATGHTDETVQIWKTLTGEKVLTFAEQKGPVGSISWSPDSKSIVSGANLLSGAGDKLYDLNTKVWDSQAGQTTCTFNSGSGGTRSAIWSPVNDMIASQGYNKDTKRETLNLWNAKTGQGFVSVWPADSGSILSITWSPDGKYIALSAGGIQTISPEGHITIMRSDRDEPVLTYGKHPYDAKNPMDYSIGGIAWSHDGERIASYVKGKNTIEVWQAPA